MCQTETPNGATGELKSRKRKCKFGHTEAMVCVFHIYRESTTASLGMSPQVITLIYKI
jgi:hypothetical protein